jgi:hypothetical protein
MVDQTPLTPTYAANFALRGALPAVLDAWEELSREEPWHIEPDRFGVDALSEVIRAVLDAATDPNSEPKTFERLVRVAVNHGEQRRSQGAGDDAVLREYHALRQALWRLLEKGVDRVSGRGASDRGDAAALVAVFRIDVAISAATTAALRGYHREASGSAEVWDASVIRFVSAASAQLAGGLHGPPK